MPEQLPVPRTTERFQPAGPAAGDAGGIEQSGSSYARAARRLEDAAGAADLAGEAAGRAGRHPVGQTPGGGTGAPPAPGNDRGAWERRACLGRLIQIGNLPDSLNAAALQGLFEPHGSVRSATINRYLGTGRSTGVGFVEMESADGGTAAIAALNQRRHLGHVLSVCWTETGDGQAEGGPQMFGPMNMADGGVVAEGSD